MQINGIHHVNIGCRESDLPAIERFYCEGLGLKVGPRPNFPNGGLWLYCGAQPVVHVVTRFKPGWPGVDDERSSYDHTAYAVSGVQAFRERPRVVVLAGAGHNGIDLDPGYLEEVATFLGR